YVVLLRRLMEEFKWDKISMITHSMSSINGFVFSALFPDKVDMFVGLDVLKPITRNPDKIVDSISTRLEDFIKMEKRMRSKSEPPCYEWEQLVERLHIGTEKSVSVESCQYLLQRNSKPSQHEPHKYYFARDSRLKSSMFYPFSREVPFEMAKRIKCPHLFIKALGGPYYEPKENYDDTLEILKQNPLFEYHEVEGTHHVHLNNPERVAPIINDFISRWRT
ncbi:probable serine hydrolase, partial [Teleopsis dalmanni]|uniref:probable serine hydrolase n=1 Tax=Teleopsis dalmanni TaxID=139649 RepID=UPI0018CFB337